jgi:hypothetical protein
MAHVKKLLHTPNFDYIFEISGVGEVLLNPTAVARSRRTAGNLPR